MSNLATDLVSTLLISDVFIHTISIAPLQVHFYSEALPTQHGYCAEVSRRSATGNCELGTCRRVPIYVAVGAGIEPTTLRLKAIDSTNAPPRPTSCVKLQKKYECNIISIEIKKLIESLHW